MSSTSTWISSISTTSKKYQYGNIKFMTWQSLEKNVIVNSVPAPFSCRGFLFFQLMQKNSRLAVLVLTARRRGASYLGQVVLGQQLAGSSQGSARVDQPPVVFVCTGQDGPQFKNLPFSLLQPNTARLIGSNKAKRYIPSEKIGQNF